MIKIDKELESKINQYIIQNIKKVKMNYFNNIKNINEGGEGSIYELDGYIVKVFDKTENLEKLEEKGIKICKLMKLGYILPKDHRFSLPVVLLIETKIDKKNGKEQVVPVGFYMNKIQGKEFAILNSSRTCKKYGVTLKNILEMLLLIKNDLELLHDNGIVIGDLNERNILFDDSLTPYIIDCDSWAIDNYKCDVIMPNYRDPLVKSNNFTRESDNYAFMILAFKMLTRMHPFGGVHPDKKYENMQPEDRMPLKAHVLTKGISLPKNVRNFNILSNDLVILFKRFFEGQTRTIGTEFEDFYTNLNQCEKCNEIYWNGRKSCPCCGSSNFKSLKTTFDKTKIYKNAQYDENGRLILNTSIVNSINKNSKKSEKVVNFEKEDLFTDIKIEKIIYPNIVNLSDHKIYDIEGNSLEEKNIILKNFIDKEDFDYNNIISFSKDEKSNLTLIETRDKYDIYDDKKEKCISIDRSNEIQINDKTSSCVLIRDVLYFVDKNEIKATRKTLLGIKNNILYSFPRDFKLEKLIDIKEYKTNKLLVNYIGYNNHLISLIITVDKENIDSVERKDIILKIKQDFNSNIYNYVYNYKNYNVLMRVETIEDRTLFRKHKLINNNEIVIMENGEKIYHDVVNINGICNMKLPLESFKNILFSNSQMFFPINNGILTVKLSSNELPKYKTFKLDGVTPNNKIMKNKDSFIVFDEQNNKVYKYKSNIEKENI